MQCNALAGKNYRIRVTGMKTGCLFFREVGETFNLDELVPWRMCHALWYRIYPQYLALLYDGVDVPHDVECASGVMWFVSASKFGAAWLINLVERFFWFIGRPKDLIDKEIILTRASGCDSCATDIQFRCNQYSHLWSRRYFCPAVYHTLYPLLVADQVGSEIVCPADNCSIRFSIERGPQ